MSKLGEECVGCRLCQAACSLRHLGQVRPDVSALKIKQAGPYAPFEVTVCFECKDLSCVEACPVGALVKRPDGRVAFNPDDCTGCQACVDACPSGICQYDDRSGRSIVCDGCDGHPWCVDVCPSHVLERKVAGQTAGEGEDADGCR